MTFCSDARDIFYTIGMFMLVFKIVIPVLLIVFGMVDLGKAVISSDDKAVSKAAKSLLNRVIAGVCIFFVPLLVSIIFKMVGSFGEVKDQFDICANCISSPTNSKKCPEYVQNNKNNQKAMRIVFFNYIKKGFLKILLNRSIFVISCFCITA